MRRIDVALITQKVAEMFERVNHVLSDDVSKALKNACENEESALGRRVLSSLCENMEIAEKEMIPICQDTGMAVVFLEIGQEVELVGGYIEDAVHEGVRIAYEEGYLRKSVVLDPLDRVNTKDNTPAIIHERIVKGDKIKITISPKGFGSENMSKLYMLKPAQGVEGVKDAVIETVKAAGPNACPPFVIGVGIGGDFEKAALMAKHALTREVGKNSEKEEIKALEEELLSRINSLNIGPAGLGGSTTALAVNIETYPTHIAGLPVAVNMCCHVDRHSVAEI
ncbi:MAG: fumarate hydratase [Lachnospiraceae bacterium]|nr:fumarate hydratase [Lachnospiraceae bacterium]